jgi:hypothetical protein
MIKNTKPACMNRSLPYPSSECNGGDLPDLTEAGSGASRVPLYEPVYGLDWARARARGDWAMNASKESGAGVVSTLRLARLEGFRPKSASICRSWWRQARRWASST